LKLIIIILVALIKNFLKVLVIGKNREHEIVDCDR